MTTRVHRWNGTHGKGAMRERRAQKRGEAQARSALTPTNRRRAIARAAGKSRNSQLAGAKFAVMLFLVGKSLRPLAESFRAMGAAAARAAGAVNRAGAK